MQIIFNNDKLTKWQRWAKIYFLIFTAVGFTMFIMEESMQVCTFGAFAYQNAKDMAGLRMHTQACWGVHDVATTFIRYVGWLNPLMWPAYLQYTIADERYWIAMDARVNDVPGTVVR